MVIGISPTARTAGQLGLGLAFDRLDWVRVVLHDGGTRYEVVGTARHRPRTCQVSTATAVALIGAGIPTVVSRSGVSEP